MAIKVIITRKVARGKEGALLPLLMELRAKDMEQKGYISGETLKGISDPDEFMVISTWNSLENWDACLPFFVKVFPMEYRRVLGQMIKEDEETEREEVEHR